MRNRARFYRADDFSRARLRFGKAPRLSPVTMSATIAASLLILILAGLLLRAAIGDMRTFNISNELNFGIAALAPLYWSATDMSAWPDVVLTIAAALLVFALLAGAFYLGMMGGGDVKMAPAVLLWFPAPQALDFLLVMSVAGGIVTLIAVARHRILRREGRPEVPYGVAISAAGLWSIAEPYLNQFNR